MIEVQFVLVLIFLITYGGASNERMLIPHVPATSRPTGPTATPTTKRPTATPTSTRRPSPPGTILPTPLPTLDPTRAPTDVPTLIPSNAPIDITTVEPTSYPSLSPNSIVIITTVAGVGTDGYGGDNGAATSANIYTPSGIVIDSSGNIYVSDSGNNRIRKITKSTGIITTFAGTGSPSYSGDNEAATGATLSHPTGLGLDILGSKLYLNFDFYNLGLFFLGNIYISDTNNNCIRKITVSTSIITTVAGSSTSAGYSGDNGQATAATFDTIVGIALDSSSKYN